MTRALLATLWFVAACFDPHYDHPACSDDGDCPGDLHCGGGICYSPDEIDAALDASEVDAIDASEVDAIGAALDAPAIDAIDAAVPRCPAGYTSIGTSTTSYRLVTPINTWAAAATDCDDDDDTGTFTGFTHLVVIDAEAERLDLTGLAPGNTWVGLSDQVTEGTFVWVTAEPTGGYPIVGHQPPWDTGDPDGEFSENCVRLKNNFLFEDRPCADMNKYLCECDGVPPLQGLVLGATRHAEAGDVVSSSGPGVPRPRR